MRAALKAIEQLICVFAAALCAAAAFCLTRLPAFEKGKGYELYYAANSSASACITEHPLFTKLTHCTAGESVRYEKDCYEQLKKTYRAELVFSESAAGVKNYYLYSPLLGNPVDLGGRLVNLHIAVSEGQTVAGTPLIFGGY